MKVLDRKLRRELIQARGMLASIAAILVIGVMCLTGVSATSRNLEDALEDYYARCRMPDAWVQLKKAPLLAARAVAQLEGVAEVRERIQFPVTVDLPLLQKPVRGLVFSLPDASEPVLSQIILAAGSYFPRERSDEVIVSRRFAQAHGLEIGSVIPLVMNGQRRELHVVGTAYSSEFIYLTAPGALVPDPASYGLFFIAQSDAAEIFDFEGAFNSLIARLTPAARENPRPVLDLMERELEDYGVFTTYPVVEQSSNLAIRAELDGLKLMATFLPIVFFGVAALILSVLMQRMVQRQRVIVGTMKAVGIANGVLVWHFVKFGLFVGVIGGVVGCACGQAVAVGMTAIYRSFFEFPSLVMRFYPLEMLVALGLGLGFSGLGALRGAITVLKLSPAAAMRPVPPVQGGRVFLERFVGLWAGFGARTRMVWRNLLRNRMRTGVGVFAAMMGSCIVILGFGMGDAMREMMHFQFDKVMVADYSIQLRDEGDSSVLSDVRRLPGVSHCEPVLVVPGTFRHQGAQKRLAITGLRPGDWLQVPHDRYARSVSIPQSGLLIDARLARELAVVAGDKILFETVKGEKSLLSLPVSQIIEGRLGVEVFADYDWLNHLVGERDALSMVHVAADAGIEDRSAFLAQLKDSPRVEGVSDIRDARAQLDVVLIAKLRLMTLILIGFAGVIFFGSVLNSALVSLAERKREVGTFRAIGWDPDAISRMFLHENLVVNAVGVLLGLPLGWLLLIAMANEFQNDMMSMPATMEPISFLYTVLLSPCFVFLAHIVVRSRVRKMNWLRELSAKE